MNNKYVSSIGGKKQSRQYGIGPVACYKVKCSYMEDRKKYVVLGEYIDTFNTAFEAAVVLDIDHRHILKILKNKGRVSAYGLTFISLGADYDYEA